MGGGKGERVEKVERERRGRKEKRRAREEEKTLGMCVSQHTTPRENYNAFLSLHRWS